MPGDSVGSVERAPYVLKSRGHVEIPLSQVLDGSTITVFPHILANPELLGLRFVQNTAQLVAGKFIGLIPLAPGVLVDVRPKLPISNLAHVLDVAGRPVGRISGVDRTYLATDARGDSVLDFLTSNLVQSIHAINVHGWLKDYQSHTEVSDRPRGRIDINGTLKSCWSRGASHHVKSSVFQQTSDNPPNRLLRHVLETLLRARSFNRLDAAHLNAEANLVLSQMPSSVGGIRGGDQATCEFLIARQSLPTARGYYYRALEIALTVMSGKGISFQTLGVDITLETSIIDFETVFEDYVRKVLQTRARGSVIVRDGNFEGKRRLYDNRPSPLAQPDIVILPDIGGQPVVADVKYKDAPKREDINQAVTYAMVYRSKRVVLIHQSAPGKPPGRKHLGTVNHIEVYAYGMNLDDQDLSAEEGRMAAAIFELLD